MEISGDQWRLVLWYSVQYVYCSALPHTTVQTQPESQTQLINHSNMEGAAQKIKSKQDHQRVMVDPMLLISWIYFISLNWFRLP